MNSRVLIKAFDYTNIQYEWIEVDFNTFAFNEGNSALNGHTNNFNLSITVSVKELHRLKESFIEKHEVLFSIAN